MLKPLNIILTLHKADHRLHNNQRDLQGEINSGLAKALCQQCLPMTLVEFSAGSVLDHLPQLPSHPCPLCPSTAHGTGQEVGTVVRNCYLVVLSRCCFRIRSTLVTPYNPASPPQPCRHLPQDSPRCMGLAHTLHCCPLLSGCQESSVPLGQPECLQTLTARSPRGQVAKLAPVKSHSFVKTLKANPQIQLQNSPLYSSRISLHVTFSQKLSVVSPGRIRHCLAHTSHSIPVSLLNGACSRTC